MTLLNVAIQVEGMMEHYATTENFVVALQEADFYFWQWLQQRKIVRNVCGRVLEILCHNKIAKQVAGKIAKCNRGLKERWSFG